MWEQVSRGSKDPIAQAGFKLEMLLQPLGAAVPGVVMPYLA